NQGQACIAGSRLLIQERVADEFLDKFITLAKSIRIGNPLDAETEMGPLTSTIHRDRVLSYVDIARQEGGEILAGGQAPQNPDLAKGCYIEPTVVLDKASVRVSLVEVIGSYDT